MDLSEGYSFNLGGRVISRIDFNVGIITKQYENWEDLKSKNEVMALLENKDRWLDIIIPSFTEENLLEKWYQVKLTKEISTWNCESRLANFYPILNNVN